LEPLLYAASPSERASESLEGRRADLVSRSAADLVPLGPDILKVEFPGRGVEAACRAGASGFLGGRAVWEDALRFTDRDERRRWLQTTGADRMRRLSDVAGEYGRPWWKKYAPRLADL